MLLNYLRKHKQGEAEAYFRRCRHYVAAGHIPVCLSRCRVCEGARRFIELLKFYAQRDQISRPEREFELKSSFKFHEKFSLWSNSSGNFTFLCEESPR